MLPSPGVGIAGKATLHWAWIFFFFWLKRKLKFEQSLACLSEISDLIPGGRQVLFQFEVGKELGAIREVKGSLPGVLCIMDRSHKHAYVQRKNGKYLLSARRQ